MAAESEEKKLAEGMASDHPSTGDSIIANDADVAKDTPSETDSVGPEQTKPGDTIQASSDPEKRNLETVDNDKADLIAKPDSEKADPEKAEPDSQDVEESDPQASTEAGPDIKGKKKKAKKEKNKKPPKVPEVKDDPEEPFRHLPDNEADILKRQALTPSLNQGIAALYRYTTGLDILIMIIASICSIGNGAALPLMTLLFGGLQQTFSKYTVGLIDKGELSSELAKDRKSVV